MKIQISMFALLIPLMAGGLSSVSGAEVPPSLRFETGPVNAIAIERGGARLVINAAPGGGVEPDRFLLTHARREVVEAARDSGAAGKIFASVESRVFLEGTGDHWERWWSERFNYYGQQVTRRPIRDLPAERYLSGGEGFVWQDLKFRTLATPGYTRDGITYLTELDGIKVAFSGDLILAGGKVPDLYSFQEEIPEAKIGGYHGYLGRLAQWLDSIEALAAEKPDLVVPARGPLLERPAEDLAAAAALARQIYRNYLETNALHWYFGEERMKQCADRVLGPDHGVVGMPLAEHVELPGWCQHIGTTKLLVSESGRGFALDVGGAASLKSLIDFSRDGLIQGIDGLFVTHVHNDHTAAVAEAQRHFDCPVYALPEVAAVLSRPGDSFLPGISPNAVETVTSKEDGSTLKWEEFTFTFRFFPGQMFAHGALLVEKAGETAVFFIGDSFSPTGIDDYCLMNRNLMREDTGYLRCFAILDQLPGGTWLVNQHIPHRFRFNAKERDFLLSRYRERLAMIARFVDWDDPNYAIDEQWAFFYPYGSEVPAGKTVALSLRLWNHSTEERRFEVRPSGTFPADGLVKSVTLPGRSDGGVNFTFTFPAATPPGVHVITADVSRDDGVLLPEWSEALLRVVAP